MKTSSWYPILKIVIVKRSKVLLKNLTQVLLIPLYLFALFLYFLLFVVDPIGQAAGVSLPCCMQPVFKHPVRYIWKYRFFTFPSFNSSQETLNLDSLHTTSTGEQVESETQNCLENDAWTDSIKSLKALARKSVCGWIRGNQESIKWSSIGGETSWPTW